MSTTTPPIIACPVCGAYGSMLHHDVRSSLVYSCLQCTHEWQIDPIVAATADLQRPYAEGHGDGGAVVLDVDRDCSSPRQALTRGDDQ